MDDDWKLKRLQILIDQGILVEDPDGIVWMSNRMRKLIDDFNNDDEIRKLITKKAKDDDDFKSGCWSYLYIMFVDEFTSQELNEAVAVLKGWNAAAEENRLDAWSMRLRLR